MAVRLAEIPADAGAGLGIFRNLHGMESSGKLVDYLRMAAQKYCGTAGRTFCERLVKILPTQLEFGHFMPRNKPYQSRC